MNKVYLGLGSNLGKKVDNIQMVIDFFCNDRQFSDIKISSLYETVPYGEIEQDNFINAVIAFSTEISLDDLFIMTKDLEKQIGRLKRKTWGPREIDIDILLFGDLVVKNDHLSIPHEDLLNRDFVIVPLMEVNDKLVHPIEKKKIKSFLSELNDKYIIGKINFNYSHDNLVELS